MKPLSPETERRFVVATPARSVCDDNARALERHNRLRFIALGTRRGTTGVPPERTRLNPWIGLAAYVAARTLSPSRGESFRFRLHPWFDRWVKRQLQPGDHIISSYGHTNECFQWARQHGGKMFLDGGNSHPDNYWTILAEEHRRWKCSYPPMPRHHYERSVAMMEHVDYVLSPSSYVTKSFLARGFKPEQILRNVYPVKLSCFSPAREPRPASRPLTLICTGSLSLRKGTPYLLEAIRIVRRKIPGTRLLLTRIIEDSMRPILPKYQDLPIEWSPPLPHSQLAERLRSADIFLLPSLEEGLVRTALEAMACGLPVVLTPHTGANDLVEPGVNGEVVPIRDPQAIADAVLKWADKILAPDWQPRVLANLERLSFEHFEREFLEQLRCLNLAGPE
jgi:glycosyltransferase involved in cell wall biosynthesis